MPSLLAAWRFVAFFSFTFLMFVVVLVGRLLTLPWPQLWRRWRIRFFRFWANRVARLIGMRIDVVGTPPKAPFLLVANHLSYLDIVALAHCTDAVFVAKHEVAHWPILGPIVRSMSTIFIDRSSHRDLLRANREVRVALERGDGVVVFAEGTSSDGTRVLPIRTSMLEVAVDDRRDVRYARLAYATPSGHREARNAVCWWGEMPLLPHVFGVFRIPHFKALVHFGPQAVRAADRKDLAGQLHERISALPAAPLTTTSARHKEHAPVRT